MMKNILTWLKNLPIPLALVGGLVLIVLLFANPFTLMSDIWHNMTTDIVSGNDSVVVTDVKAMGKLKVLKRFVGGFLEIPSVAPVNAEDREHFRVVYQWEGSAEFTVDLARVDRITNAVNRDVVLRMPDVELENLRELSIEGDRCVITKNDLGYSDNVLCILDSMPELIAREMRTEVDTKENRKKAREQAEYLLRSMIQATGPNINVKFEWESPQK